MSPTVARERLRLLQVVLSLNPGGTERLVIELCKRLQPRADQMVCCLDEPGSWAAELEDLGIPVVALERRPGFRPSLAFRLARYARRHRATVLHCHHYSPFVYGALAARLVTGMRLVFTEHGRYSDGPPSRKRRAANLLFGRLPGRFFAVSPDLREHLIAEGFPGHRVAVAPNGIDPGPLVGPAARSQARARLGLPEKSLVLATVARLDPVKDLGNLIEAFAEVATRRADARLVVVGDGPERRTLEERASEAGLADRVLFTGARDDVREILPGFDLYLNTSVTEGVSVTILEAMAASLPVIATRVGGTPGVVEDGRTGVLVPARDKTRLARAIGDLVADPSRMRRLGREGRARVEAGFSLAAMVEIYLEAYGFGNGTEG